MTSKGEGIETIELGSGSEPEIEPARLNQEAASLLSAPALKAPEQLAVKVPEETGAGTTEKGAALPASKKARSAESGQAQEDSKDAAAQGKRRGSGQGSDDKSKPLPEAKDRRKPEKKAEPGSPEEDPEDKKLAGESDPVQNLLPELKVAEPDGKKSGAAQKTGKDAGENGSGSDPDAKQDSVLPSLTDKLLPPLSIPNDKQSPDSASPDQGILALDSAKEAAQTGSPDPADQSKNGTLPRIEPKAANHAPDPEGSDPSNQDEKPPAINSLIGILSQSPSQKGEKPVDSKSPVVPGQGKSEIPSILGGLLSSVGASLPPGNGETDKDGKKVEPHPASSPSQSGDLSNAHSNVSPISSSNGTAIASAPENKPDRQRPVLTDELQNLNNFIGNPAGSPNDKLPPAQSQIPHSGVLGAFLNGAINPNVSDSNQSKPPSPLPTIDSQAGLQRDHAAAPQERFPVNTLSSLLAAPREHSAGNMLRNPFTTSQELPTAGTIARDRIQQVILQTPPRENEDPMQRLDRSLRDLLKTDYKDDDDCELESESARKPQYFSTALPAELIKQENRIEPSYTISSSPKLEAASCSFNNDERQTASKAEGYLQSRLQNLTQIIQDLLPARIIEARAQSVEQRNHPVFADAAAHGPVKQVETFISSWFKSHDQKLARNSDPDLSRLAEQPNSAIKIAKNQIVSEAISLKDLVALNRAQKGEGGKNVIGSPEQIAAIKALSGKNENGILGSRNEFAGIKAIDGGKIENILTGLKGAEAIDTKITGKTPAGLMPPEKPEDRKDLIDKKEKGEKQNQSEELSEIIAAAKKKARAPKEKEDGKNTKKEEKDQESRKKYTVKSGDSLESIAEKILGDRRFSFLLELINRGMIRYSWQGSKRQVHLRVGQILWLPTSNEIKVHTALYLNKVKNQNSDALPVGADLACRPSKEELAEIEAELPTVDLVAAQAVTTEIQEQTSEDLTAPERAGSKQKQSDSSWSVIQEFMERMRQVSSDDRNLQTRFVSSHFDDEELPSIENDETSTSRILDQFNRITVELDENDQFKAKLERNIGGVWALVASYETRDGRSVRYLNKQNGARSVFHLNLPDYIVKEMALRDLGRNWKHYGEQFERQSPVLHTQALPGQAALLA